MVRDMTTGNPVKLILSFSIPLLIGNIFQQFYNMVDAIIVGRFVGVQALAAVGATGSLAFLVIGFIFGLTSGFCVLVAQRFGAGDYKEMRHVVGMSLYLSVGVTLLLTIIMLVTTRPLLEIMNTPPDIIVEADKYISIIYAGMIATMFYNFFAGILRALGDSKTPLYFLIIASLLNVVLDLFFVVVLQAGSAGAAYATVISQGVSAILCFVYIVKKFPVLRFEKGELDFRLDSALKLVGIGLPMALQFSITASGVMILQSAINSFGSTVVGAYTAASKVEQLTTQPLLTFGTTMAVYVGQNLGAGKLDRIREGVKKGVILSIIASIVGTLLVVFFGKAFITMFIAGDQLEAIDLAVKYLKFVSIFYIPLGLIFIFRNTLQALGYGLMPMLAGVAEMVVRTFFAFFVATKIGFMGICIANPAAWFGAAIPLTIAYLIKMNKIKKKEALLNE